MRLWKILLPITLTCSGLGSLSASPESDLTSGRLKAESLETRRLYLECGQAYSNLYLAHSGEGIADELLYKSGHCYEKAGESAKAIKEFVRLNRRFPQSQLAKKAMLRSAALYGLTGEFESAARYYEEYAKRYVRDKDAPSALMNAITYRKKLGHFSLMEYDIDLYWKRYRKKRESESFALLFLLATENEKVRATGQAVRVYERYLKEVGEAGGYNRLLVVNAKLGGLLWDLSCAARNTNGVCGYEKTIPLRRTKAGIPNRCGEASATMPQLVKRNRRLQKRAKAAFARVSRLEKLVTKEESTAAESKELASALVTSKFFSLAGQYEDYLRLEFPRGLSFPADNTKKYNKSTRRFMNWLQSKQAVFRKLSTEYTKIKNNPLASPTLRLASVARMGLLAKNFSDSLRNAGIPVEVRTDSYAEDGVNAFCDQLQNEANPLADLAVSAFKHCLELSTSLSVRDAWTKRCERELGNLRPAAAHP